MHPKMAASGVYILTINSLAARGAGAAGRAGEGGRRHACELPAERPGRPGAGRGVPRAIDFMKRGFHKNNDNCCTWAADGMAHTKSLLVLFLSLTSLVVLNCGLARAEVSVECVVKRHIGSVQVSDVDTGKPITKLTAGARAYLQFLDGFETFIIDHDKIRKVDGITAEMLDCGSLRPSLDYPVVFKGRSDQMLLLKELGILPDPGEDAIRDKRLPRLPRRCFSVGAGQIGMEFTERTFAAYERQGFSLDNLCLAFTSGEIKFDPETGNRLPTYVLGDRGELLQEIPFYVPTCFARGKAIITKLQHFATMKPLGCEVKYHPWSGRALNPGEVAFFTREASLSVAGDAGGSNDDSLKLGSLQSRRGTAAKIQAVKIKIPEWVPK
jgi:hypothetical protein